MCPQHDAWEIVWRKERVIRVDCRGRLPRHGSKHLKLFILQLTPSAAADPQKLLQASAISRWKAAQQSMDVPTRNDVREGKQPAAAPLSPVSCLSLLGSATCDYERTPVCGKV